MTLTGLKRLSVLTLVVSLTLGASGAWAGGSESVLDDDPVAGAGLGTQSTDGGDAGDGPGSGLLGDPDRPISTPHPGSRTSDPVKLGAGSEVQATSSWNGWVQWLTGLLQLIGAL